MSKQSYTCIEQLDLAAEQLRRDNPSYARFALILTDNVVELIFHRACSELIRWDEGSRWSDPPRYSAKQREDALGQKFGRKAQFLLSVGKISPQQSEYSSICHGYRNELYHSGLKHDDIIQDIAWHYHDFAISLFEKVNPNNSWSSRPKASHIVAKHAGADGQKILGDISCVANSLRKSRPSIAGSLAHALAASAIKRAQDVAALVDYLVKGDPKKRSEVDNLLEMQFYDYLGTKSESFAKIRNQGQYQKILGGFKKVWKPRYQDNPMPKFVCQAVKIEEAKDNLCALKAYARFGAQISYIEGVVNRAATAFEDYIEEQIDMARGN